MGWAYGTDANGREIGYGVVAVCDQYTCSEVIDRGLGYRCGPLGCEADDEPGCGDFFCGEHLFMDSREGDGAGLCAACIETYGPDPFYENEEIAALAPHQGERTHTPANENEIAAAGAAGSPDPERDA